VFVNLVSKVRIVNLMSVQTTVPSMGGVTHESIHWRTMVQLKVVIAMKAMVVRIAANLKIVNFLVIMVLVLMENARVMLVGRVLTVLSLCATHPTVMIMVYVMEMNGVIRCVNVSIPLWEKIVFRSTALTTALIMVTVLTFSADVIKGTQVNVVSTNWMRCAPTTVLNMDVVMFPRIPLPG